MNFNFQLIKILFVDLFISLKKKSRFIFVWILRFPNVSNYLKTTTANFMLKKKKQLGDLYPRETQVNASPQCISTVFKAFALYLSIYKMCTPLKMNLLMLSWYAFLCYQLSAIDGFLLTLNCGQNKSIR